MFVQTKMNSFSASVMEGGFLVPDVETYTSAAVFTLGKSSETTGYWCHGLQVIYMIISGHINRSITSCIYFLKIIHRMEL